MRAAVQAGLGEEVQLGGEEEVQVDQTLGIEMRMRLKMISCLLLWRGVIFRVAVRGTEGCSERVGKHKLGERGQSCQSSVMKRVEKKQDHLWWRPKGRKEDLKPSIQPNRQGRR